MRQSRLPQGGTNLFQAIKAKRAEATAKGIKILNLSIGQPTGPALLSARETAAKAVMSDEESMHEYQDNGSPGVPDFACRFVARHVKRDLADEEVSHLPLPGNKPMLGLVPLACGLGGGQFDVATTTEPGYPTPADWCRYLRIPQYALPLNPQNDFRFGTGDIATTTALIMMNYPHNPTGQIATKEWLQELCGYCEKRDIRIFNDNPYYVLSHDPESTTLTDIAADFKNLSWAEAFSASKVISNGTGWRVGAMVGSPDFIDDIAKIKGNTDSGFAAPMAAGVLAAVENDQESIAACRTMYKLRIGILIGILRKCGMELAVNPRAGFFTLWKTPKKAFGEEIASAEQFNYLMIEHTGATGVHFNPLYIRYAVTSDVVGMANEIEGAFKKAKIS